MEIWVRHGPDFHAGSELEQWLRKRIDGDHASAVVGCIYEIFEVRQNGFAARRFLWQQEGFGEIWTFRSLSFRIAAKLPGDGRAETHDLCLVASERTEAARVSATDARRSFLDVVKSRLSSGSDILWEL